MQITREDIVRVGLEVKVILDFTLTNAEANSAVNIAHIGTVEALSVPPPYGEILALVIQAEAANIQANNHGRGVGANIHYILFPAPPHFSQTLFFPL